VASVEGGVAALKDVPEKVQALGDGLGRVEAKADTLARELAARLDGMQKVLDAMASRPPPSCPTTQATVAAQPSPAPAPQAAQAAPPAPAAP
jgi:hypothetical protein